MHFNSWNSHRNLKDLSVINKTWLIKHWAENTCDNGNCISRKTMRKIKIRLQTSGESFASAGFPKPLNISKVAVVRKCISS